MKTKKIILSVAFLILGAIAFSQTIPNGSFENWSNDTLFEEPDTFQSTNYYSYITGLQSNVSKTTDSYGGNYAAKLETTVHGSDTVLGALFIGTPDNTGISGGLPYTDKPDTLKFALKYNILTTDTAMVAILFKNNGIFLGGIMKTYTGTQPTWLLEEIPITWMGVFNPDTITALISCSKLDGYKIPGSYLFIDEIEFSNATATPFPNGDFESWTPVTIEEPDDWTTINFAGYMSGQYSAIKTNDSYDGNYAVRLETVNVYDDSMGFITNGELFDDDGPEGGMAVSQNPKKITGYYKYTPVGPDTALVGVYCFRNDQSSSTTTLLDSSLVYLPAAYNYTYFEVPLTYNAWPLVDTLNISFASSNIMDNGSYVGLGSVLYLDSLNVSYYPLSVDENLASENDFLVYPNPAKDFIYIESKFPVRDDVIFSLYNSQGKLIFEENFNSENQFMINISKFSNGIYFYKINTQNIRKSGKILKK